MFLYQNVNLEQFFQVYYVMWVNQKAILQDTTRYYLILSSVRSGVTLSAVKVEAY